jgi:hypothetical protein
MALSLVFGKQGNLCQKIAWRIKMILQLDPYIPVWIEGRGTGYAIGWKDYSQEHNMLWIVAFDDTGEVWEIPNPKVRLQKNYSMGRMINAV